MPKDIKKLLKKRLTKRRSTGRIGPEDPIVQEIVKIINKSPSRTTVTGVAKALHYNGLFPDISYKKLRGRVKRRMDRMTEWTDERSGKPVLKRRMEIRVDEFGEVDGSTRGVYFTPDHEWDVKEITIDDLMLMIEAYIFEFTSFERQFFGEWADQCDRDERKSVQDWEIDLWKYFRQKLKDIEFAQIYAIHAKLEQDEIVQKRVRRDFSAKVSPIFGELSEDSS